MDDLIYKILEELILGGASGAVLLVLIRRLLIAAVVEIAREVVESEFEKRMDRRQGAEEE